MMKSPDGLYINIHEAALVNYPAMLVLNLVIFQYFQEATGAALNAIQIAEILISRHLKKAA